LKQLWRNEQELLQFKENKHIPTAEVDRWIQTVTG